MILFTHQGLSEYSMRSSKGHEGCFICGQNGVGGWNKYVKTEKIKGIICLTIAGILLIYIFYAGYSWGDIKIFFPVVIILVCGFIGIMYLKSDKKKKKKRTKKTARR